MIPVHPLVAVREDELLKGTSEVPVSYAVVAFCP